MAFEILEGKLFAGVGGEGEFGGFLADFEHWGDLLSTSGAMEPLQKGAHFGKWPLQKLREQAADYFVDGLRIGLAFGGFHDLTDEEFEYTFVAGFEFGDVVRIFLDDFASGFFDGIVVDLRAEAFGGDDFDRGATSFKHGGEHFFADGSGDFSGVDEHNEFAQRCWGDRAGVISLPESFRRRRSSVCIQLAAALPGAPAFTTDFKIIRQGLCIGQNFGVVGRDAVGSRRSARVWRRAAQEASGELLRARLS